MATVHPPGLLRLVTAALCMVYMYSALAVAFATPAARNKYGHGHGGEKGNDHAINRRTLSVNLDFNPDYAPNGPAAYARALMKWGAKVPGELVDVLVKMKADNGTDIVVGVTNADSVLSDREYLSRIGFGTPPQYLNVDIDTGSSDVWVYTSETRESVAGNRPVFDLSKSKTAKRVENTTWMITYGDGSRAWGNVYTDHIDINGQAFEDVAIESAIAASASLADDPDIDGVFGLAYNLSSQTDPVQPTVLSKLAQTLHRPVFTADLRYHSSAGAYTFGYVDFARSLNGSVFYIPLVPGARFWQFEYTGFNIANSATWFLPATGHLTAIADTGTTLLLLPPEIVRKYYTSSAALASLVRRNATLGGIWTFPCDLPAAPAADDPTSMEATVLPDLKIGLGGIPGVGAAGGGGGGGGVEGFVATVPGRLLNYTVLRDDPRVCMGGLQEFGGVVEGAVTTEGEKEETAGRVAVFGDIFLKAVYAVFDVGGGRIGFGPKNVNLEPEW